jgi:hypothetical protein
VKREVRSFQTTTQGLLALSEWLSAEGCTHVVMEATGVYWKPVWHILSDGEFELVLACESAWNKDPVFGVIGIQSGPPGQWVHSGFRGGHGSQVGDAGSGDDREDPSRVFRSEEANQDDLP